MIYKEDIFARQFPAVAIQIKCLELLNSDSFSIGKDFEKLKEVNNLFCIGFSKNKEYYGPFKLLDISFNDYENVKNDNLESFLRKISNYIPLEYYNGDNLDRIIGYNILSKLIPADILEKSSFFLFKHNFSSKLAQKKAKDITAGFDYFFSFFIVHAKFIYIITIWYD